MMTDLKRLASSLNLDKQVRFEGSVENVYTWMQDSDALLITSNSEGLPTVFLEALHMRLPVYSTKCSSQLERMIETLRVGMVSDLGDAEQMARNIISLHTVDMADTDIERTLQLHSPTRVALRMHALVESAGSRKFFRKSK
jgi:glycosyltransferase involved in cell wall biosynthesis